MKIYHKPLCLLLYILPATGIQAATLSNNNLPARVRTDTVNFNDLNFSSAVDAVNNNISVSGGVGDSGNFTNNVTNAINGFQMYSGSGVTLSNIIPPTTSSPNTFTATINNNVNDNFGWNLTNTINASGSSIVQGQSNGYNTLTWTGAGNGFVENGGTYTINSFIEGDWTRNTSGSGYATGQVVLNGTLNSAWSITNNFVYNPVTNLTEFSLQDNNYIQGSKAGVSYTLYGDVGSGGAINSLIPLSNGAGGDALLNISTPTNDALANATLNYAGGEYSQGQLNALPDNFGLCNTRTCDLYTISPSVASTSSTGIGLSFHYDPAQLNSAIADSSSLAVWGYNQAQGQWVNYGGTVNSLNNTISIQANSLPVTPSQFIVAEQPQAHSLSAAAGDLPSRTRTTNITFTDSSFADALDSTSNTVQVSGNVGQSGTFSNSQKTGAYNWVTNSGSGVVLSNVVSPQGTNPGHFTATIVDSANTSLGWSQLENATTTAQGGFNASTLVYAQTNGYNTLEYQGGGSGMVSPNGSYLLDLFINGNWSNQGTGVDQTQLVSYNNHWSIAKDFVFDPNTNKTEIELVNNSYISGDSPSLDFILHGTQVGSATSDINSGTLNLSATNASANATAQWTPAAANSSSSGALSISMSNQDALASGAVNVSTGEFSAGGLNNLPGNFGLCNSSACQEWNLVPTTEPSGTVTLTFSYDPSLYAAAATAGTLEVWHYNTQSQRWEDLYGQINTANNTVTVTASSLSPFVLTGAQSASAPVPLPPAAIPMALGLAWMSFSSSRRRKA